MVKTLRQFIADRDYEDPRYRKSEWWADYELIGQTLYNDASYDWEQSDRFRKGEDLISYDLQSWVCTDTQVGLEIITLNGEPSAIIWQCARKANKHMLFVSEEARKTFTEKWELYKEEPEQDNLMSEKLLDTPYGPDGDYFYGLDEQSEYPEGSFDATQHIYDMVKAGEEVEQVMIKHAISLTEKYIADRQSFIDEMYMIRERDNLHDGHIADKMERGRRDYIVEALKKFEGERDELRDDLLATLTGALDQEQNLSL